MFKVGDEVFVKGNIAKIEEEGSYPISVGFDKGRAEWFEEEELIPVGKTYEQGLVDAWALANKVGSLEGDERVKIFDHSDAYHFGWFLENYTPAEALAKIEAYEKGKEIKVGDEVVHAMGRNENKLFVTSISDGMVKGFEINEVSFTFPNQFIKKTGKHIDIESLLRQIGE